MHSVLPHVHHEELSIAEHEEAHLSADSLLDYIELIFHTDIGDGHLEHFASGQGLDFELSPVVTSMPVFAIEVDDLLLFSSEHLFIAGAFYLKDDPFPKPQPLSAFSLRGPPFIS